jgi:hypothetical protein
VCCAQRNPAKSHAQANNCARFLHSSVFCVEVNIIYTITSGTCFPPETAIKAASRWSSRKLTQLRGVLQSRDSLQRRRTAADPAARATASWLLGHPSGAQRFPWLLQTTRCSLLPTERATGWRTREPRGGTRLPRVQHPVACCCHSGFHAVGSSLDVSSTQTSDTLGLWDVVRCAPDSHGGRRRNRW